MVLLHGINNNIIIPRPSYFGVYQDEAKIRVLQGDKYFWGWDQTKKCSQNSGACLPVNIENKI